MDEMSELHQYTFSPDGGVTYRRCFVTKIWPNRGMKKETWVSYKSYSDEPYSCKLDVIDHKIATMSCHKVIVLTEPNFEKAKEILANGMRESIDRHQKIIDSLNAQLDRLDILEVGKKTEGFWDF